MSLASDIPVLKPMTFAASSNDIFMEPGIIEISGHLDCDSAVQIEEDALLCIRTGMTEMLLDCRNLDYISSAGVQSFLRIAREMRRVHGRLAACNLQPQVHDVFDAVGMEHFIAVYEDETMAKEALAAA